MEDAKERLCKTAGSMEDATERLFKAAVVGDTEVLEQLKAERPAAVIFSKRNGQGDLSSHVALQHGNLEFAKKICSYYPPALWVHNGKGDGLLHMAAKLWHDEFFLQDEFFLEGARLLSQHFQGFSYDDKHDERIRDADDARFCVVNGEGKSLLYVAAEKGYLKAYLEAAKLLLENQAYCADMDKLFAGPNGSTAFHIATRERNYDMVQIFLQHGVPYRIFTRQEVKTGYTPLHIAVSSKEPRLAKMILTTYPSSTDILDRYGFSPFHLAVRLNMTEMYQLLLSQVMERLFKAAVVGDTVVLGQLADVHPAAEIFSKRNDQGDLSSHVALRRGHREFAKKICYYYPPALWVHNGEGDGLLHMAAKLGHDEFFLQGARLLSQHFQDFIFAAEHDERRRVAIEFTNSVVNGEGESLLYMAAEKGYRLAAELLLRNKSYCLDMDRAFIGPDGSTALHIATRNRNYDIVQIFLQHGVPDRIISRQEVETGNTPLHIAVFLNEPILAEMFLTTHPSSANNLGRGGFSPLHLVVQMNQTEMFKLFLKHRPDCCMTLTDKGQNALHIAVERNIEGVISVIVKDKRLSELMINQQEYENGNTPLHLAAYKDDKKMHDTLLGCQAIVKPLKNKAGLTFQDVDKSNKEQKQKEKKEKMQIKLIKGMEDFQSSLLVMATLIITVTFTAAFTLPGGYNGNQPNQGVATLADRAGFAVFLVTDTMSMGSSIVATAALVLFSLVFSTEKRFNTLKVAIGAIALSIIFMLMAFTAGVWLVIGSQRRWLAFFIAVITSCIPLCLILLVAHIMLGSGIEDVSEFLTKKNESEHKLDSDVK